MCTDLHVFRTPSTKTTSHFPSLPISGRSGKPSRPYALSIRRTRPWSCCGQPGSMGLGSLLELPQYRGAGRKWVIDVKGGVIVHPNVRARHRAGHPGNRERACPTRDRHEYWRRTADPVSAASGAAGSRDGRLSPRPRLADSARTTGCDGRTAAPRAARPAKCTARTDVPRGGLQLRGR